MFAVSQPDTFLERLYAFMVLDEVHQFGPQKFREVLDAGMTPEAVVGDPSLLPIGGKRGDAFRNAIKGFTDVDHAKFRRRATLAIERAKENDSKIVVAGDLEYPPSLWASNNPVPILYVRGTMAPLSRKQAVACVGSREIRPPYSERQIAFAGHAAATGRVVVSGFALGADSIAHRAARDAGGETICVMPCGLDRPFPPENKNLWEELLSYPGASMVSEFPFATQASALTLRKRNKTIVALASGVLIGQSSTKGGAMNAYRFGVEQKKPVATFTDDGSDATSGNAQITVDPASTSFPADRDDLRAWDSWLSTL